MGFLIVVAIIVIGVLVYRQAHAPTVEHEQQGGEAESAPAVAQQAAAIKPAPQPQQAEHPDVSPNVPEAIAEAANALSSEQDPLKRHRWLTHITDLTYKKRDDAQYRAACDYYATLHISEFAAIKAPLKESNSGKLPQVMTFQNYANLLLEDERFEEAIEVCRKAIKFGLDDKTQTGFEGRIGRIQAKQKKANA